MSKRFTAVLVLSAFRLLALAPAYASAQRAHEQADSYSSNLAIDL